MFGEWRYVTVDYKPAACVQTMRPVRSVTPRTRGHAAAELWQVN